MESQPAQPKPTKGKPGRPKKLPTWEEALAMLPPNATTEVEMNWIAAHPAMYAKTRETDEKKKNAQIILTSADLLSASHGIAPSRAAAVSLQYWCNNHDLFFRQILMEQKKKTQKSADSADRPDVVSKDVQDLEAYLKEIEGV